MTDRQGGMISGGTMLALWVVGAVLGESGWLDGGWPFLLYVAMMCAVFVAVMVFCSARIKDSAR